MLAAASALCARASVDVAVVGASLTRLPPPPSVPSTRRGLERVSARPGTSAARPRRARAGLQLEAAAARARSRRMPPCVALRGHGRRRAGRAGTRRTPRAAPPRRRRRGSRRAITSSPETRAARRRLPRPVAPARRRARRHLHRARRCASSVDVVEAGLREDGARDVAWPHLAVLRASPRLARDLAERHVVDSAVSTQRAPGRRSRRSTPVVLAVHLRGRRARPRPSVAVARGRGSRPPVRAPTTSPCSTSRVAGPPRPRTSTSPWRAVASGRPRPPSTVTSPCRAVDLGVAAHARARAPARRSWSTSAPATSATSTRPCSLRTTTAVPGGTRSSRCVSKPTWPSRRSSSSRLVATRSARPPRRAGAGSRRRSARARSSVSRIDHLAQPTSSSSGLAQGVRTRRTRSPPRRACRAAAAAAALGVEA